MRNAGTNLKDKLVSRYLEEDQTSPQTKVSDINILLNRIELNKKSESRKKLYFSAAASTGLILFGFNYLLRKLS